MNINFPETLEEITVWALENSTKCTDTVSYFRLCQHRRYPDLNGAEVSRQVRAWIHRIVQLEGAVSHRMHRPPRHHYRVTVAGIFVWVATKQELAMIYNNLYTPVPK
jgi:hypothetical protein